MMIALHDYAHFVSYEAIIKRELCFVSKQCLRYGGFWVFSPHERFKPFK